MRPYSIVQIAKCGPCLTFSYSCFPLWFIWLSFHLICML